MCQNTVLTEEGSLCKVSQYVYCSQVEFAPPDMCFSEGDRGSQECTLPSPCEITETGSRLLVSLALCNEATVCLCAIDLLPRCLALKCGRKMHSSRRMFSHCHIWEERLFQSKCFYMAANEEMTLKGLYSKFGYSSVSSLKSNCGCFSRFTYCNENFTVSFSPHPDHFYQVWQPYGSSVQCKLILKFAVSMTSVWVISAGNTASMTSQTLIAHNCLLPM